ncbi:MAG: response regulator [Cyclobacteriaceae bacterium]|nr:response regulator [Cyclobacteriaceae bacterium]
MEQKLKILMLEDQEDDAGLIDRALQKERISFVRRRVDTRDEFEKALDEFKPDVILSDHALPQFNSIEALRLYTSKKLNIPFILVTGTVSEEFAVYCLKRGADDYVLKSNLSRLPLAIRYALRQHRNESNRQIQEEMLRKQNEELIKINHELDAFVYSVSHDLRSPLSSILGVINILKLDTNIPPEPIFEYVRMIEKSVLKLDETLQGILNYSRNARGDLLISEVNVRDQIRKVIDELRYIEGMDKISFQVNVNGHTALFTDEYRLSVILTNLISNAIKYADQRKERSVVQIEATVTPAHLVMIVRDNGIGIPKEHISRVFGMFYRATEKSMGAGLGLYIVKEAVDKLSGSIVIQSQLGTETLVRITIPNRLLNRQ